MLERLGVEAVSAWSGEEALESSPLPALRDPEAAYKIAQGYAALGDRVSALRVLRSSVAGGFFPYPYLRSDPLLEPLRREPELAEILNIAQRRYQAFKDRFF
jgi:hypothetical protein